MLTCGGGGQRKQCCWQPCVCNHVRDYSDNWKLLHPLCPRCPAMSLHYCSSHLAFSDSPLTFCVLAHFSPQSSSLVFSCISVFSTSPLVFSQSLYPKSAICFLLPPRPFVSPESLLYPSVHQFSIPAPCLFTSLLPGSQTQFSSQVKSHLLMPSNSNFLSS